MVKSWTYDNLEENFTDVRHIGSVDGLMKKNQMVGKNELIGGARSDSYVIKNKKIKTLKDSLRTMNQHIMRGTITLIQPW